MAMRLQREYSLPVVAVRLAQDGWNPAVRIDLIINEDGEPVEQGSETFPLQDFAARSGRRSEPDPTVPDRVVQFVAGWADLVLEDDRALWLHLVKPYGLLGAIPWERHLVPALDRPLLRLPDALPEPARSTEGISVAIVATAPAPEGPPPALVLGAPLARAFSDALPGRVKLHLFVDPQARPVLRDQLLAQGLIGVEVHETPEEPPPADPTTADGPADQLRSGWLRWVRDALAGRSLDVVHFLVHGNSLGTRGAILTPLEATAAREIPVSVEANEIDTFLTQVGALVAGFTRLPDNWSDHGLRQVMDELGARRAGPVLLHDPAVSSEVPALAEAYRFLTSPTPSTPPTSASLALYAQPAQVARESDHRPAARGLTVPSSEAVQAQFAKDETPGWLAAAQRYLEHQELTVMRFHTEALTRTPSQAELSHYAGVESALQKARDVIDRHAERLL